jgi:hypothetical protein
MRKQSCGEMSETPVSLLAANLSSHLGAICFIPEGNEHEAARTHCSSAERRGLFKCRSQFLRIGAVSVVWVDFCVNNRAVVGDHEMHRIGSVQLSLPLLGRAREIGEGLAKLPPLTTRYTRIAHGSRCSPRGVLLQRR